MRKKLEYPNSRFDGAKFCSWCFGVIEYGRRWHAVDCNRPPLIHPLELVGLPDSLELEEWNEDDMDDHGLMDSMRFS
jgi:hypothetical protein